MSSGIGLCLALMLAAFTGPASAHQQSIGIGARKVVVSAKKGESNKRFLFQVTKEPSVGLLHDPAADGMALHVSAIDPALGHTGLIELDSGRWKTLGRNGRVKGFKYVDKQGLRGGVRKVIVKPGRVTVVARGRRWPWAPDAPVEGLRVHLRIEDEWFCSEFGGTVKQSKPSFFKAVNAERPFGCPEATCGNGVREPGEACDDGNLVEDDGCTVQCEVGPCSGPGFATTFDALQAVVFEGYDCTNATCHGAAAQGGLALTADQAWASLVAVPANGSLTPIQRVQPGEPEGSFLYQKLAAKTLGTPLEGGAPMPLPGGAGPAALSDAHLEALARWIRGGAPRDRIVADTAALLATCLPPPDPLKLDPIPPPAPGEGFQVRQPPRPLPAESESEVCSSTFYDLTESSLIPPEAFVPCPPSLQLAKGCSDDVRIPCDTSADCAGECLAVRNVLNPDELCIRFNRFVYAQDPQSHHALVREYRGAFDHTHPGWGSWSYRFEDPNDPRNGQPCDPTEVDPDTGIHAGCGTEVVPSVACIGYGPPDYTNLDVSQGFGSILTGGSSLTPSIAFTGEPYLEGRMPDGSADVIAARGLLTWNSHAFNLTSQDSTLAGYLNVYLADPIRDTRTVEDFFDADSILVANVKPFETEEYCRTYEVPQHHELFKISSHTHRHGVLFRIWSPPNAPCVPGDIACRPRDDAQLIYRNTDYADPLELTFDPPVLHAQTNPAERSYLYCAVYDNGSTPGSPSVKRRSTSPEPPSVLGFAIGGPCSEDQTYCANEGPARGTLCGGDDRLCDSSPGAGDGDCDACTLMGGLTTEDEMFAMLGSFVLP